MSLEFPHQDSPLDLLRACHVKMRQFATGLERLAPACLAGDARVPEAARAIARYLREALPLHAEDEDHSLGPRLLPAHPELAAVFAELELGHARIHGMLPAVCADLDTLAAGGRVDEAALAARATALTTLLREHAQREEDTWFPLVSALPAPVQATVRQEMADRRTRIGAMPDSASSVKAPHSPGS